MSKGAQDYLTFLINTSINKLKVENVPVVKEFLDMSLDELVTLPPKREIEFNIDSLPGTAPISKTSYRISCKIYWNESLFEKADIHGELKYFLLKRKTEP